jgi:trimethylamine--corrinoid protein Co-methyltransferase
MAGGAEALREKPFTWYFCEPASPLRFTHESLEILRLFCEKGLPVSIGPMVQAGLSGPVTLAGTVVQTNAEIVAGVTIAQILSPGNPVEYGGVCHIADMRSGDISFGSPEQGLLAAAMAQIGCSYGFAVHVNTGLTDAIVPDAQSGIEKATTMAVSAMAGAEMFGHLGIAGADQGASLEQLVIDNEIAGYVKRLLKGIRVTDETLAVDVIRQTRSKSYLSTLHTTKHVRSEQWFPTLLNRARWEDWIGKNGKDLLSIARDKKEKILAEHKPEPLDTRLEAKIDAVVKQYVH